MILKILNLRLSNRLVLENNLFADFCQYWVFSGLDTWHIFEIFSIHDSISIRSRTLEMVFSITVSCWETNLSDTCFCSICFFLECLYNFKNIIKLSHWQGFLLEFYITQISYDRADSFFHTFYTRQIITAQYMNNIIMRIYFNDVTRLKETSWYLVKYVIKQHWNRKHHQNWYFHSCYWHSTSSHCPLKLGILICVFIHLTFHLFLHVFRVKLPFKHLIFKSIDSSM